MSFDKIVKKITENGFVKIRITKNGNHQFKTFTCKYTAISKSIDWLKFNPVVV